MDQLTHSLKGSPTCPYCGIEMQLCRSELVQFVPITTLYLFNCRTCLLFAESEAVHEPVWVSPGRLAGHDLRFFAAAA